MGALETGLGVPKYVLFITFALCLLCWRPEECMAVGGLWTTIWEKGGTGGGNPGLNLREGEEEGAGGEMPKGMGAGRNRNICCS